MAAPMLARLVGPSVVGLVWSKPLSIVISAAVPAALRQRDVLDRGVGDDLVREVDHVAHLVASTASPSKCGFSQMTAPPIPMPMHMAVRP